MKLKLSLLLALTISSLSSHALCLMVRKPMKIETMTCEGLITKNQEGMTVSTGKRVQIKVDLGNRSRCYKSYVGYKVSVYSNMTITETIYDDGDFPENGVSTTLENIEGRYAAALTIEGYKPNLGVDTGLSKEGELTALGGVHATFVQNMDYLKNSYRSGGERIVHPKFRQATLNCRSTY